MKKETPQEFIPLRSEVGYRGRAFTVRKDTLKLPNGRETVYDIIDHPGAVTIIPVDKDGNIYFVRQFRPATGEVLLELPAGTLENGEDPYGMCGTGNSGRDWFCCKEIHISWRSLVGARLFDRILAFLFSHGFVPIPQTGR